VHCVTAGGGPAAQVGLAVQALAGDEFGGPHHAPGALVGVAMANSRSRARRRTLMSASFSAPVIDFWCLHDSSRGEVSHHLHRSHDEGAVSRVHAPRSSANCLTHDSQSATLVSASA
jgi:ferredoxin-NADP reductase